LEMHALFELQEQLELQGYKLTDTNPDFIATAQIAPNDASDSINMYNAPSVIEFNNINEMILLKADRSVDTSYQFITDDLFITFPGPKGIHFSPSASVFIYDAKTKRKIFSGCRKATNDVYDRDLTCQFLLSDIIFESLPRKKTPVNFTAKSGVIGIKFNVLSYSGHSFYPFLDGKPFWDSPARQTDLQSGDLIFRVDGISTRNKHWLEIVKLIRGDVGKSVHLDVYRMIMTNRKRFYQYDIMRVPDSLFEKQR
jgi:hypothetical protein